MVILVELRILFTEITTLLANKGLLFLKVLIFKDHILFEKFFAFYRPKRLKIRFKHDIFRAFGLLCYWPSSQYFSGPLIYKIIPNFRLSCLTLVKSLIF
jgi:hypothetical protein